MVRSIWKGAISFGLIHIPVDVVPASAHQDLDLKMIDRRDFAPIGYRRINKDTGAEVEWPDIIKAYEYQERQYVVLSDEELQHANVRATQTIDIVDFVHAAEIDAAYFEQPYYLRPGKGGEKVYALLLAALGRSNKAGIAQIVIHTRQHLAALLARDNVILLNTLRYADEVHPATVLDLPDPDRAGLSEREIALAQALVGEMSANWNPLRYHDTYRDDVLALVREKVRAGQTHAIAPPEAAGEPEPGAESTATPGANGASDLLALLRQSLRNKPPAAPRTRRNLH